MDRRHFKSWKFKITNFQKDSDALVFVEFKDREGVGITYSAVKVNGKEVYYTEGKSDVTFSLPKGKYIFKAYAIGYAIEETKKIKLTNGDSLYLPIVMKLDTLPLY